MKNSRTISFFVLFVFLFFQLQAQKIDVDRLMSRHIPNCEDITLNCMLLVPAYYNHNQTDTLNALLDYWETNCHISEPLLRIKILLAIKNNVFSESLYPCSVLDFIDQYRSDVSYLGSSRNNWYHVAGTIGFYNFTRKLAGELKSKPLSPLESFFADLYSDNFNGIFLRLKGKEFAGTLLQHCYLSTIRECDRKSEGHWALYVGAWYPFDNLNLVGIHPVIGGKLGIKYRRLILDLSVNIKFVNSANSYQVFKNDSLWDTRYFFGAYIGIDAGFEVLRHKKHEIDLIGGLGYEGFDALKNQNSNSSDKVSVSLSSLNLNFGLGYRFYLSSTTYIGLQGRYNFVNFLNHKGTNLSGNTMEFYILIGNSGNNYKSTHLRMLDVTK